MDNLFEAIGPIIIITIYGVGVLLQKIAKAGRSDDAANKDTKQQSQRPQPQRRPQEASRDMQETLMRQLQEALGGPVQKPAQAEQQKTAPPPLPGQVRQKPEKNESKQAAYTGEQKIEQKMQMPIKPIKPMPTMKRRAASVDQNSYDHLAVIQSPADMNRAILAYEILGPPRAKRPWRK